MFLCLLDGNNARTHEIAKLDLVIDAGFNPVKKLTILST
jgi:hypothetical protein